MKRLHSKNSFRIPLTLATALIVGYVALPGQASPITETSGVIASEEAADQLSVASLASLYDQASGQTRTVQPRTAAEAADDSAKVDAYWTKERLMHATPVSAGATSQDALQKMAQQVNSEAGAADPEVVVEPKAPVVPRAGGQAGAEKAGSVTNGKVFFRDARDGKDKVCSGAAVNSDSRRLVSTAAHCIHGGKNGTWHQNWVFIPGYNNGAAPYGKFSAYKHRVMSEWVKYGESVEGFGSDVGFVTTYKSNRGRLVDVVGGHGIVTGGSNYTWDATIFGYPNNLQSGQALRSCATKTKLWPSTSEYRLLAAYGCGFGQGSSGGPWLRNYNSRTGLGYIKSVIAFGTHDNAVFTGPFFRKAVSPVYHAADNDW